MIFFTHFCIKRHNISKPRDRNRSKYRFVVGILSLVCLRHQKRSKICPYPYIAMFPATLRYICVCGAFLHLLTSNCLQYVWQRVSKHRSPVSPCEPLWAFRSEFLIFLFCLCWKMFAANVLSNERSPNLLVLLCICFCTHWADYLTFKFYNQKISFDW